VPGVAGERAVPAGPCATSAVAAGLRDGPDEAARIGPPRVVRRRAHVGLEVPMSSSKLFGIILLIGGLILLGLGIQRSDSVADSVSHFFTGEFRDETVWMIVIGGLASAVGLGALIMGPSRTTV
jgi:hypothetical protein